MKPRLLLITHVNAFPGNAGQQQRVKYTIKALQNAFHITVVSFGFRRTRNEVERNWLRLVDEVFLLPSVTQRNLVTRIWHWLVSNIYVRVTGLERSHYMIGRAELSAKRIAKVIRASNYDIVLFEYWYSHEASKYLRSLGIPTVIDMHDVLWQSFRRKLGLADNDEISKRIHRYRIREEKAWKAFDAIIGINEGEAAYVREVIPDATVFLAQMGTDLALWPYTYEHSSTARLGFWGSLGSEVNRLSALRTVNDIMPLIWEVQPDIEIWLVGANPTQEIMELTTDSRIHVTGFVEEPACLLGSMTAIICPWEGTYGFRSRLVEVMACGLPVVASPDAVYGMGMTEGDGLLLGETDAEIATLALRLLAEPGFALEQSRRARRQVETKYSFDATYGQLAGQFLTLIEQHRDTARRLV